MARFCFIWIILVGAMVAMREDEHFTVYVMPTFKSDRANAISYLFVDFATFIMAMIFVVWGWPLERI
ncbi:MAG: TRAP transporter small permease subunit [Rhizobiaceae bacterium]|nr:TRAP transporter small permease subunit [Rhizobiaceae bacterium]